MMRALNRHVERVFSQAAKTTKWGRRKVARDLRSDRHLNLQPDRYERIEADGAWFIKIGFRLETCSQTWPRFREAPFAFTPLSGRAPKCTQIID
jgi:hypothetical protein